MIFRTPVTVVLSAVERKPEQQFADIESAARALTAVYGFRVIIDASTNSLPDSAIATKREKVLEVEPMARDVLESMPELKGLLDALKEAGMADITWTCVGGNPADYRALLGQWEECACSDVNPIAARFVRGLLGKAVRHVVDAVAANKRLKELYARFTANSDVLDDLQLTRQSPDKILRAVRASAADRRGPESIILVPADAATALVLRFGLRGTPSMEELQGMVKAMGEPFTGGGAAAGLPPRPLAASL